MAKNHTFNRYIFKIHIIFTIVILLSYSILLWYFFMRGLDEATLINMRSEIVNYADNYQKNDQKKSSTPLANFQLSQGYIDWQALPDEFKENFPDFKVISQEKMNNVKIFNLDYSYLLPEKVLFIVAYPLTDGKTYYLLRSVYLATDGEQILLRVNNMLVLTWPLALFFLLLMLGSMHFILRKITKPMQQLGAWTDSLTLDDIDRPVIDFGFKEVNLIAQQQQSAFERISDMVKKEHDFLRHASHELRTPIAVIKSNIELLERLLADSKATTSINRIKRANVNMQYMIETLLWLTREDERIYEQNAVNIAEMVRNIVEDNQYLLQGKLTKVNLALSDSSINIAKTACRLTLNNLIRNAFQYTATGDIFITLIESEIIIENINHTENDIDHTGTDYGYGLGLHLVDRIVDKMTWQYQNIDIPGGRKVMIDFRRFT
ncbi:hypothetical protein A9Q74_16310 [Colwellia sp. 39_35_sub15_T18]|nr:hypothetical protein A9Q74_16310 [Colwellia sp. 39_35_sub15_T18]